MNIIIGNIVDATEDFILHQVNCKGVMGAGVAGALSWKYGPYLTNYFIVCDAMSAQSYSLLGTYVLSKLPSGQTIVNLFGQDGYGRDRKYTNEFALQQAIIKFCNELPPDKKYTCAIPYKIGCGLGGGDWDYILEMLKSVENHFSDKVSFTLYQYNK